MVDIDKTTKIQEGDDSCIQKMTVGYARVSTEEQEIATQIRLLKEKSIPDHLIFTDEATSGGKAPEKRPGWSQLMKFIRTGEIGTLYTYEVSRIGRNTSESIKHILTLEQDHKVLVLLLNPQEQMLNNCEPILKPLLLSALALGADMERRNIQERTKAGLARVKEFGSKSGKPIGRPAIEVDFKKIDDIMQKAKVSRNAASKFLGYSPATFYRKVRKKKEQETQETKQTS